MPDIDSFFPDNTEQAEDSFERVLGAFIRLTVHPQEIAERIYSVLAKNVSVEYAEYTQKNIFGTFDISKIQKIPLKEQLGMLQPEEVTDVANYLQQIEVDIRHFTELAALVTDRTEEEQEDFFKTKDPFEFPGMLTLLDYILSLTRALQMILTMSTLLKNTIDN